MVTPQEIELLAGILQRAGVTQIEAIWLNDLLIRLRALVSAPPTDKKKANQHGSPD